MISTPETPERQPDLAMAAAFLAALCGHTPGHPSPVVTFQTFDDSPAKATHLARVFHGTLTEHAAALAKLNAQGAGIFVNLNETDLQGRKAQNQISPRALCIDWDGPATKAPARPPSFIVHSGSGDHWYWLLCSGESIDEFSPALKHLATFYGSDPKATLKTQVMRVPGFFHSKQTPTLVTFEPLSLSRAEIAELLEAHPLAPTPLPPARHPKPFTGDMPSLSERVYRASRYLEKVPGAVAGQSGHDQTWAAALAVCRGLCLPYDAALELLTVEYNPRCTPPWTPQELEHKVRSAIEDGRVREGYLLAAPKPQPVTRIAPFRSSAVPVPQSTEAPEPTPAQQAAHGISAGLPPQQIAPLIAQVSDPMTRDQLISQLAHERRISKGAVTQAVKQAASRRRGSLRLVTSTPAHDRPDIYYDPGRAREILTQAETALLAAPGPAIYQRSGQLVRVIRLESLVVRGLRRPQGALSIVSVDPPYLCVRLTESARWHKRDARSSSGYTEIDAPFELASRYLSLAGEWRCQALVGLLEAPTLRPDGSLLEEPGYDESTGLYYDRGETTFPAIPAEPTQAEAHAALGLLLELLKGFPFVATSDRAAALSAILTALARPCLRSAPLHLFRAPRPRSGKSLLADVVALLATGRTCAVMSQVADPEEERKRLLAILLSGDRVLSYDNVERELGSPALCQVLTQQTISDRILGASRVVSLPTAATFLATGNNLMVSGDLTSRVVTCDLDSGTERPEERTFPVNLYEDIPRRRGELVAAALTILRAYHVAGRPRQPIPAWGGFEEWSDLVRSSLVWLGEGDPAGGRERIEDADPVRAGLRRLLTAWSTVIGEKPHTVAEVLRTANLDLGRELRDAFEEVIPHKGGEVTARALGKYLAGTENRIESGLKVVRCGIEHKVALWAVVSAKTSEASNNTSLTPEDSGGFDGFGGFGSNPYAKTHFQENLYIGSDGGKPTPSNPQTPRPFLCDFCGSTESRPSTTRGIPVCVVCCPPKEAP